MTYQIEAIHIFNEEGRRRSLPLKRGQINFIPGGSKKGKTSLIDIIEYCFGSSGCPIKKGPYLDKIHTFCLEMSSPESPSMLLARPAPRDGAETTSRMHFSYKSSTNNPDLKELEPNSDVKAAVRRISAALGIGENEINVGEGSRQAYPVTARHSLYFLLHPQQEIADPSVTFHGQQSPWEQQSIRDVLPYFMGAADPLFIYKKKRISTVEREIKLLLRGIENVDPVASVPGRALRLLHEAAAVGLIEERNMDALDREAVIEALSSALSSEPSQLEMSPPSVALEELLEVRDALRNDFHILGQDIGQLRSMLRLSSNYGEEMAEQHSRLHSLNLLRIPKEAVAELGRCPLCSSELLDSTTNASEIVDELKRVEAEIDKIADDQPGIQRLLGELEERKSSINQQLRENDQDIRNADSAQRLFEQVQDTAVRRAEVRGKVSLYLESNQPIVGHTAVTEKIERLRNELEELRSSIDVEESRLKLQSALSRVGYYATKIASALELEHAPAPVRLDVNDLTIVVDTASGSVPLLRIGSGESWLGYRLALILALCKVFSERRAPVPHFLVLDQPSQVYFQNPSPPDDASLPDEDEEALVRIYELLETFVEEEDGRWQMLITDHAEPPTDWLNDALVERWRGPESGLVPADW